jgi:shikimate dehydrogenase
MSGDIKISMENVYGIIGKRLSHSFSKSYFEKKFKELDLENYSYSNFEIADVSDFPGLLKKNRGLKGLNVTNPYKEQIIPFLDELFDEAREIGAVNCINIENNKLTGYNTDVYGFAQSIKPFLDTTHQKALVLGTGGASKAVAFALKKVGVEVFFVTSGQKKKSDNYFFYGELNEMVFNAFKLIINTTPLGMFPEVNAFPEIPYRFITSDHLCYDLIYNPEITQFLKRSKEQGATTINGLSMLHLQAEKSQEIWGI